MSLLSRLLRRFLPGLIDAAVDEVEELSAPTQRSVPLSHKDSERQAAASRGPFKPTREQALEYARKVGMPDAERDEWLGLGRHSRARGDDDDRRERARLTHLPPSTFTRRSVGVAC